MAASNPTADNTNNALQTGAQKANVKKANTKPNAVKALVEGKDVGLDTVAAVDSGQVQGSAGNSNIVAEANQNFGQTSASVDTQAEMSGSSMGTNAQTTDDPNAPVLPNSSATPIAPALQAAGGGLGWLGILGGGALLAAAAGGGGGGGAAAVAPNNPATITTGNNAGTVLEAGGAGNATVGTPTATGTLTVVDPDAGQSIFATPANLVGVYGSLAFNTTTGVWTYTLNNSSSATQALVGAVAANAAHGISAITAQSVTETFVVTSVDGTASRTITINVTGGNDNATITGAVVSNVYASSDTGVPSAAAGQLTVTDIDVGQSSFAAPLSTNGVYGTFTFTAATGAWTYQVDNTRAATQAIPYGAPAVDTLTVYSLDGTASQAINVNVFGSNNSPVAVADGPITTNEDTATAAISVLANDTDPDGNTLTVVGASANNGTVSINASGALIYTPYPNFNGADTVTYTITDGLGGFSTSTVAINVTAVNDAASTISGQISGTAFEAGGVANATGAAAAGGSLTVTDVDNTGFSTTLVAAASYGTASINAAGVWAYNATQSNATVQALNVGQSLTDTFTVQSADGTSTQVITVTIQGANDNAVYTPTIITGSAIEAGGAANGTPAAGILTGTVPAGTLTDVDNTPATWMLNPAGTAVYGTFTVAANGSYTYTLNQNDSAVQALNGTGNAANSNAANGNTPAALLQTGFNSTLTDTITLYSADGSASQAVTITINGNNDNAGAIFGYNLRNVAEAGSATIALNGNNNAGNSGTAAQVTGVLDVLDADNFGFQAVGGTVATVHNTVGGYGHFNIDTAGNYLYYLDNSMAEVQALNTTGATLTDSVTVYSADGTSSKLLTFTINGSNDNAGAITGLSGSATVIEAGSASPLFGGNVGTSATGTVSVIDIDSVGFANATGAVVNTASGFGSYTLTAATIGAVATAGVPTGTASTANVVYTVNNTNATVQALNLGQTLTDTFTIASADGTSTTIATVTIQGSNDAAGAITGQLTGTANEAGNANQAHNGNNGVGSVATGSVSVVDVDNTGFTVVNGFVTTSGMGSYSVNAAGQWSYTVNNANSTVNALNVGQSTTDSFIVTSADGTSTQSVTVTIQGSNDNAGSIAGATSGSVTEAGSASASASNPALATTYVNGNGDVGTPSASGLLTVTDSDSGNGFTTAAAASANGFGSYTMSAIGLWTFNVNNANNAVQQLNAGQTLSDSFVVYSTDGTASQTISVTINGSNDLATNFTVVNSFSAVENGSADQAHNGNNNLGRNATGLAFYDDADSSTSLNTIAFAANPTAISAGLNGTNGYGHFYVTSGPAWGYQVDNSNGAVQALNVGGTLTDSMVIYSADGTASQTLNVTINGSNDAATYTATVAAATIGEAGGLNGATAGAAQVVTTAIGTLTDVDSTNNWQVVAVGSEITTAHGRYSVDSAGVYTYTVNQTDLAVQALNGTTAASGNGQSLLQTGYNSTLTDTFTIYSADGTASQSVTMTINGANDNASAITGFNSRPISEAGSAPVALGGNNNANASPTAGSISGVLEVSDSDNVGFQAVSGNNATVPNTVNGYGHFYMDAGGNYVYYLNNSLAPIQALNVGQSLTDSYTVFSADGTSTHTITFTINGSNDAATIGGSVATAGVVVETGVAAGSSPYSGTIAGLTVADVDNNTSTAAWMVVTAGVGAHGTYTVAADGTYVYTLTQTDSAVQALNAGGNLQAGYAGSLTDTIIVTTADGTASQAVTITINGSNDQAGAITGTFIRNVVEAGSATPALQGNNNSNASGSSANLIGTLAVTDVDNTGFTGVAYTIGAPGTSGYGNSVGGAANNTTHGRFAMDTAGNYYFTVDNSLADVQALNVAALGGGTTLTDTFTVTSRDGTSSQVMTFIISGSNDAASAVTVIATTQATEQGLAVTAVNATGTVAIADVDNVGMTLANSGAGTHGTFTLTNGGTNAASWTYVTNEADTAVQALNAGDVLTDTIIVTSADGTASAVITATINGSNDAATAMSFTASQATETSGDANATLGIKASGTITVTDFDDTGVTAIIPPVALPNNATYGNFTVNADGTWTYAIDNADVDVEALNVGDTLTDSITVYSADGTATTTLSVTINGANDNAAIDISSTLADTAHEIGNASVALGGHAGSQATGTVVVTDIDNTNITLRVTAAGVGSTSNNGAAGYGHFTVSADGNWTYDVDNTLNSVNALNDGDSLTDTFTVYSFDHTVSETITVTIQGHNDIAGPITGQLTGTAQETGTAPAATVGITASGTVSLVDVDNTDPTKQFTAIASAAHNGVSGYGAFTVGADGTWSYVVDNSLATVQALNAGATLQTGYSGSLTDSIVVTSFDGTSSQTIVVTINGQNDAAATVTGALTIASLNLNILEHGGINNAVLGGAGFTSATTTTAPALPDTPISSNTYTGTVADGTVGVNTSATASLYNATVTYANTFTDVDNTNFSATTTPAAGTYGTFAFNATTGAWTYALNETDIRVQQLNSSTANGGNTNTLTDSIVIYSADRTASQTLNISIYGQDDRAVVSGQTQDTAVEYGTASLALGGSSLFPVAARQATGQLIAQDVDNNGLGFIASSGSGTGVNSAAVTALPVSGSTNYGTYTVTAGGLWTYTINNTNATVQALNDFDATNNQASNNTALFGATGVTNQNELQSAFASSMTDTFTVTTVDGSTQVITVIIEGHNDTANFGTTVFSTDAIENVDSAAPAHNGSVAGTPSVLTIGATLAGAINAAGTATGVLHVNDLDNDSDNNINYLVAGGGASTTAHANIVQGGTFQGHYGSLVLNANGSYTYSLSQQETSNAASGNLYAGTAIDRLNDTAHGATSNGSSTIYNNNASGYFTTAIDSFTVYSFDGTASYTLGVTVHGANDAAAIDASSTTTGTVTEAGSATVVLHGNLDTAPAVASGTVVVTDVDNSGFAPVAGSLVGTYGNFTFNTTNGNWNYTAGVTGAQQTAINQLNDSAVLQTGFLSSATESLVVTSADGTASTTIVVTVNGSNDNADPIAGDTTGSTYESGGVANATPAAATVTGTLTVTDVDNTANTFQTPSSLAGSYGAFTLDATTGQWTYVVNQTNTDVEALNDGGGKSLTTESGYSTSLTDSIVVTSFDGTTSETITVTINGTNDNATDITYTGKQTNAVESQGTTEVGAITTSGNTGGNAADQGSSVVTVDDVDNSNAVQVVTSVAGTYGTYSIAADGSYSYVLDNTLIAVQELNDSKLANVGAATSLTDTITLTSFDGTYAETLSITINGANDTAILDTSSAAVYDVVGKIEEHGGKANATAGSTYTDNTGVVTFLDIDNTGFNTAGGTIAGKYGNFVFDDTTGGWTYTLTAEGSQAIQYLNVTPPTSLGGFPGGATGAGVTVNDTLTIYSFDHTASAVATVSIYGQNDAATFVHTATLNAFENGSSTGSTVGSTPYTYTGNSNSGSDGKGTIVITDVDTYADNYSGEFVSAAITMTDPTAISPTPSIPAGGGVAIDNSSGTGYTAIGAYGNLVVTGNWASAAATASSVSVANSTYTYVINNQSNVDFLNTGDYITETFKITSDDGSTQNITVQINGSNDAATAHSAGSTTGSINELADSTATNTVSSTVNATWADVDNNNAVTFVATGASDNGYGSFEVDASGKWTYTLNDANADVNALNTAGSPHYGGIVGGTAGTAGSPNTGTLTDTFTIWSADHTYSQSITVTINGTDDSIVWNAATGLTGTTSNQVINLASLVSDVDDATHVYTFSNFNGNPDAGPQDATLNSQVGQTGDVVINTLLTSGSFSFLVTDTTAVTSQTLTYTF